MQMSHHQLGESDSEGHPESRESSSTAFPDGMVGEHGLGQATRPLASSNSPRILPHPAAERPKNHKNKNQNHTNQNHPHKKPKGQGEELNITASRAGDGERGGGYLCQCQSPKRKKKKKKKRGNDKLLHSAQHKVQTRSSCLGSEVMVSNSLVSNPCQGCPSPSPILANTSLAEAGSASLAALVLPAPSSGWTRLLATSLPLLPPNQLVLWGSTFYLKAEGCLFSVQRLLPASQTPLPHAATRWRAGPSQPGPGRPRLCSP